jgi:hypothetical protein
MRSEGKVSRMEYCAACGTPIESDSDFCGQCGATVQRSATGDALLLSVKGRRASVDLYPNKLTIHHQRRAIRGDKDIYLSRISSVQLKKPGLFTVGYIRFAFAGGQENKGGVYSAINDENAVVFPSKQSSQFVELKAYVEELIGQARQLEQPDISQRENVTDFAQLEQLASLRDRGIITADDFEAKKRQILGL